MIAELFYPKELKELIADLRAKGELDEGALKRMTTWIKPPRYESGDSIVIYYDLNSPQYSVPKTDSLRNIFDLKKAS